METKTHNKEKGSIESGVELITPKDSSDSLNVQNNKSIDNHLYFKPFSGKENRLVFARFHHYLPPEVSCMWLFQSWAWLYDSEQPIYHPFFSLAELAILREVLDFMIQRPCPCTFRARTKGCLTCFMYPSKIRQLMVHVSALTRVERFVVAMYVTKIVLDLEDEFHDGSPTWKHYHSLVSRIHAFYKTPNATKTPHPTDHALLLPENVHQTSSVLSVVSPDRWISTNKERFGLIHFVIIEMLLFVLDVEYTLEPPFVGSVVASPVHSGNRSSSQGSNRMMWENSDMKLWWYIQQQLGRSINIEMDFRPLCLTTKPLQR